MNSKRAKKLRKEAGGFGPDYEQLKRQHLHGESVDPKRKLSRRQRGGRGGNSFGKAALTRFGKALDATYSVNNFNKSKSKEVVLPKRAKPTKEAAPLV